MAETRSHATPQEDYLEDGMIVQQMLEIQDLQPSLIIPKRKSNNWYRNLTCLSLRPGSDHELELSTLPSGEHYIAVSYSCQHTPGLDTNTWDDYTITDVTSGRKPRERVCRDEVITRVLRFMEAMRELKCRFFWIAEDCIDQNIETRKQLAMNSMDLVYQRSASTLGLLSTILREENDLVQLHVLLSGQLVDYEGGPPAWTEECHADAISQTVDLLERIRVDRWWNRQWIFQEEYLAGLHMSLLIRHSPELDEIVSKTFTEEVRERSGIQLFDRELSFEATCFRQEATLFLLTALNDTDMETVHTTCQNLLGAFGKYNLLYELDSRHRQRAMSSKIFTDLEQRDVSNRYDMLPIAANTCNYATRFDSSETAKTSYGVKLCALMTYILNGEIIADNNLTQATPFESLAELLERISFCKFDPPAQVKMVTWLKDCRLKPPVDGLVVTKDGIRTRGYLWRRCGVVYTHGWIIPSGRARSPKFGLDCFVRHGLQMLRNKLRYRKDCNLLCQKLSAYLCQDETVKRQREGEWPAKHYMDLMAAKVVEAIENRQPLYLATLWDLPSPSAVFVDLHGFDSQAFTSWAYENEIDGRHRTRYASLRVDVTPRPGLVEPPLMSFVGWANGLVFFASTEEKQAIVRWPRALDPSTSKS